jgi:bifunctional non-homologous end joining protein LigD
VAAYAVRAQNGPPVSVPLQWSELRNKNFRADAVVKQTVFERLDRIEDPWKDFWRRATSLEKARKKPGERHAA